MTGIPQEQPPTDDDPLAEWLSRMMILINGEFNRGFDLQSVLVESTLAVQEPVAFDTPLQIHFGPGAISSDTILSLDSNGTITANKNGIYDFEITGTIARDGNPLISYVYFFVTLNGVNIDTAWAYTLPTDGILIAVNLTSLIELEKGDELKAFMVVDSLGVLDGKLSPFIPTLGSAPSGPSARVEIKRIVKDE